jgi:chitin disaccharide deacetylase
MMLTTELLGYPSGTKLLILNVDDFGFCFTANQCAIHTLEKGCASSCTIMMPAPWGKHGAALLRDRPSIAHGVHLTTISEHEIFRWRPLTSPDVIPSLVDGEGFFPLESQKGALLHRLDLSELEIEWRAQIEAAYTHGLHPSQLDSHCNIHDAREDIFRMTIRLASEYGLAMRVHEPRLMNIVKGCSLPVIDHPDLDSFDLPTLGKSKHYLQMLRDLPAGLSEWAIHPAKGTAELRTINPRWRVRQADYSFFNSEECRRAVADAGIKIINYRSLQPYWKK